MTEQTNSPVGRIFLIDDHPMVRQGLAAVLTNAGLTVCGEATNLADVLRHPQLESAELAIVDLALGEDNGMDLIGTLRDCGIRVLVYSMHEEPSHVTAALAAGAGGYVTKREVALHLVDAVHEVLAGRLYVSPRAAACLAQKVTNHLSNEVELSEQQQQVYRLLGQGYSTAEIAAELHVSQRTVESYCARIIEKRNLKGMHQLRREAIADHNANGH